MVSNLSIPIENCSSELLTFLPLFIVLTIPSNFEVETRKMFLLTKLLTFNIGYFIGECEDILKAKKIKDKFGTGKKASKEDTLNFILFNLLHRSLPQEDFVTDNSIYIPEWMLVIRPLIIDFDNEKEACIVKTIDYKIIKFNEMTEELAKLEDAIAFKNVSNINDDATLSITFFLFFLDLSVLINIFSASTVVSLSSTK